MNPLMRNEIPISRRSLLLTITRTAIATTRQTFTETEVLVETMRSTAFRMAYAPILGSTERVLNSVVLPGRKFQRIPGRGSFLLTLTLAPVAFDLRSHRQNPIFHSQCLFRPKS